MDFVFDWDTNKAIQNERKHGVTFTEAQDVFLDINSITIYDTAHSNDEDRYIDIGLSNQGRVLMVSYTGHRYFIRIISSRLGIPLRLVRTF